MVPRVLWLFGQRVAKNPEDSGYEIGEAIAEFGKFINILPMYHLAVQSRRRFQLSLYQESIPGCYVAGSKVKLPAQSLSIHFLLYLNSPPFKDSVLSGSSYLFTSRS